jgi:hypothetical protein
LPSPAFSLRSFFRRIKKKAHANAILIGNQQNQPFQCVPLPIRGIELLETYNSYFRWAATALQPTADCSPDFQFKEKMQPILCKHGLFAPLRQHQANLQL